MEVFDKSKKRLIMNYENLEIAIKGLKALNIKPEQFNMSDYRLNKLLEPSKFYNQKDCGTVGCFVGWLPFIKGLYPIESDFTSDYCFIESLDFTRYFIRIMDLENLMSEDVIMSFLSSAFWSESNQKTLDDAIYRAELLFKYKDDLLDKIEGLPVTQGYYHIIHLIMEDVVNEYKNLENNTK